MASSYLPTLLENGICNPQVTVWYNSKHPDPDNNTVYFKERQTNLYRFAQSALLAHKHWRDAIPTTQREERMKEGKGRKYPESET
jgi:hypothetical protein